MKVGDKVLKEIIVGGHSTITLRVYTLIDYQGAVHALEETYDDPSAYPYDLKTGKEVGNPLAKMGITSRVIPLENVTYDEDED